MKKYPPIKHQIIIDGEMNLLSLKKEIEKGGRFIVFSYTLSIFFAICQKRFSPAFFFKKDDSILSLKAKYNKLNYIFGWWYLPDGPSITIQSIKSNNKGGIDVTEDIMLNLDEKSFLNKEVSLVYTNMLFKHLEKQDLKAFRAILSNSKCQQLLIQLLIIGLYINVEDNEETYFVIGLKTNANFAEQTDQFLSLCYKKFYNNVRFDFVDLSETNEFNSKLKNQGLKLIG